MKMKQYEILAWDEMRPIRRMFEAKGDITATKKAPKVWADFCRMRGHTLRFSHIAEVRKLSWKPAS